MIAPALLLAAAALAAEPRKGATEISQDITVRAKASGPALAVPPPAASRPVVDEVLRSLELGRGGSARPSAETVRVTPESSRLSAAFPEPPFLALSPENIRALYDSWTFEIREADGAIAMRTEGVGVLRESVDWDGGGPDGRLQIAAGRRYRYRFTGRRGAREFVIESDPVDIKSFTRRQYGGETRLEAAIDEVFTDGKATFATGAERYLDRMADALRAGDPRPDGTYRFDLYTKEVRGKLTGARAKALVKRFAAALGCDPLKVKVQPMPVERSEALAAFVPASKGPALRPD
ncbi:MAG: hypothetical protein HY079_08745 [Elusimicrobia bacterium]|nr:hypothetical protein [Elusimicrobiota bacterium]